jgi:hypothetical protein
MDSARCGRRLLLPQPRVEFCGTSAELLRLGGMVVSSGNTLAGSSLALSCLQVRLGTLTLRAGEFLLCGGTFGLRTCVALLRAEHVIVRLGLARLERSLLAFGLAPAHPRDEHRGKDDQDDDNYDNDDYRSGHDCSSTAETAV